MLWGGFLYKIYEITITGERRGNCERGRGMGCCTPGQDAAERVSGAVVGCQNFRWLFVLSPKCELEICARRGLQLHQMRGLPPRVLDAGGELMERLTHRLNTGEVLMATGCEEKYTKDEWIPCSERLPELPDGKWCERAVIVCAGDRVMPMVYARSIVRGKAVERWKWVWDRIYDGPQAITHWMPLPEPPKED